MGGGGGALVKFYLYKMREGLQKKNSHAEGVVLTQEIEVVDILKGGIQSFHTLKGRGAKRFTLS